MVTYEEKLDANLKWALQEGSMHFEKESAVHKALDKITQRLEELQIPHVVVGGMAMFYHGFRRFTEHVDLLVTKENLAKIHAALEGLGYLPPFQGSKHLRDAELGVRIEFLTTGDYPGDGKPKPVAFPDPEDVTVVIDGYRCLALPRLIELKIASGMSNEGRLSDLGDVQKMIKTLGLKETLADQLNPYVAERYRELWRGVQKDNREP